MQTLIAKPATVAHAEGIARLLSNYGQQGIIQRSESEILSQISQFFVIENQNSVIGCVAIEVFTTELGEVRSLAVDPVYKNQNLGETLLAAVEAYARQLGLSKMMALTYIESFFHKYGYQTIEMSNLPEKIWRVCVKCPKFHNCDEIPVIKHL